MNIIPVILAGGGGTRLWPLSRSHYPKQFLSVDGRGSLLQQTLARVVAGAVPGFEVDDPVIACNEEHRFLVGEQARQACRPAAAILLEPVARNTAPALTCAALHSQTANADPLLLMMPADHLIRDLPAFRQAVALGARHANAGRLVTFGIVPAHPETGYGYIETGELVPGDDGAGGALALAAFREKPDCETAERYLASGRHVWNAGIFLMKASVWLAAIGTFRPDILAACERAWRAGARDGDFYRLERTAFEACPADSIDYAVMEKIAGGAGGHAVVVALDAGWSDVGSWASIWEVVPRDADGNVVRGDVCVMESADNVVIAESRLVAALGCHDLVIVETADAVMVAPRARAQDVKRVVDWLQDRDRNERLTHRRVYRPWGSYEAVDAGERFQVKRITVNPRAGLSLQMHHHRAEHWIVVRGTARVERGEEQFLLAENQSTYIPIGTSHRLENPGTIPLEIIEVQSGAYLGEDDIVRFADHYARV